MKFANAEVFNFEGALRGMRNPKNSWDLSDSYYNLPSDPRMSNDYPFGSYVIGPNDMTLAQRLIKAGSVHRKFMRQIFIQTEIEATVYEWLKMENKFIDKSALPDNFETLREIKRIVSMNYEVAYSTKHKYGSDYDEWLKTLPYADELIFIGE